MSINGLSQLQITTQKKCPKCNHNIFLIIDIEVKATQVRAMQSEYLPVGYDDDGETIATSSWGGAGPDCNPMPG